MTKRFSSGLVAACTLALCGCITQNETVYKNPERCKVEFENERAAQIFYETMSSSPTAMARKETTTTVQIPVVFEVHSHVVDGENVAFNQAVKECDSNQDGKITELEAKIFSDHRRPKAH